MPPGFPEDSYSLGRSARAPARPVAPPLRLDTPAERCCGSRKPGAGDGALRLCGALLGSLLLSTAADAAPRRPGAAALLGGVIQIDPEGDHPAPPASVTVQRPGALPTPAPKAVDPRQPGSGEGLPPAGQTSTGATAATGARSGPSAKASPPNPEPGVLVPQGQGVGSDPRSLQAAPDARPQTTPAPDPSTADPADSADREALQRELVLDRRRRELVVIDKGMPLRRFPVAVGMPGWETPVGRFAVMEMRTDPVWEHPVSGHRIQPGPDNPLGSRWIGFHRDCQGRSGFNGKEHLVVQGCVVAGFHGTPNRASIGQAASHGCVRLYDEHVRDLFTLVRVGTPVTVLP
jgi:L,D-transpeptidase ErfK/SrfK